MADALLALDLALPDTWQQSRADEDANATHVRIPGATADPVWEGVHAAGGAALVVYSLRLSSGMSFSDLREALKRDLRAEEGHASGDSLAWVIDAGGEYFVNVLRTPTSGGRPLIWVARLHEQTVPDRLPEVMAAVEQSAWNWT